MDYIYVVLSIISISFLFLYVRSMKKLGHVSAGFAELYLIHSALIEAKQEIEDKNDEQDPIHKENFIKFLSDSRDWAFTYIEDVQNGLTKFIQNVEPHIDYYDNFGMVIEGMVSPHDSALSEISKEFKELKKLLPEESDDRR